MNRTRKDLALVDIGGLKRLTEALGEAIDDGLGRHLTDEELIGYAAGSLPEDRVGPLETHIAACEECARELERIASASEALLEESDFLMEQVVASVLRQFSLQNEVRRAQAINRPPLANELVPATSGLAETPLLACNADADQASTRKVRG